MTTQRSVADIDSDWFRQALEEIARDPVVTYGISPVLSDGQKNDIRQAYVAVFGDVA